MRIAVDFDGTIVEHRYPQIGEEIPFAIDALKALQKDGHSLILWTVREGSSLDEAISFCKERGLFFWAINESYPGERHEEKGYSRKIKADMFIDDINIGGLLDWGHIYRLICEQKTLKDFFTLETKKRKKRKFLWFNR